MQELSSDGWLIAGANESMREREPGLCGCNLSSPVLSCLVPVAGRDGRGRQETESGRLVCPLSRKEDRGREGEEVGKAGYQLHIMWRKTRLGGRRDHLFWLFSAITTTTRVCVCWHLGVWIGGQGRREILEAGQGDNNGRNMVSEEIWWQRRWPKIYSQQSCIKRKDGATPQRPAQWSISNKKKNFKNSSPISGPSLSSSPPCQIPVCDL